MGFQNNLTMIHQWFTFHLATCVCTSN